MNSGPPVFLSALENLAIIAPNTLVYGLPEIEDPDYDPITVAVKLLSATPFTQFIATNKTLIFSPSPSNAKDTPYTISIVLSDQNPHSPKISVYSLSVSITTAAITK